MAERASPLAEAPAVVGADVTLSTRAELALHQVTAWPGAAAVVAQALSISPGATFRTGPLTWWLIDAPAPALAADLATALDLSSAWAPIRVSGPQATALLSRVVAIDLRDAAFPPGGFAMTGDRHSTLALRRISADGYEILVPRSAALSLWENLAFHAWRLGAAAA